MGGGTQKPGQGWEGVFRIVPLTTFVREGRGKSDRRQTGWSLGLPTGGRGRRPSAGGERRPGCRPWGVRGRPAVEASTRVRITSCTPTPTDRSPREPSDQVSGPPEWSPPAAGSSPRTRVRDARSGAAPDLLNQPPGDGPAACALRPPGAGPWARAWDRSQCCCPALTQGGFEGLSLTPSVPTSLVLGHLPGDPATPGVRDQWRRREAASVFFVTCLLFCGSGRGSRGGVRRHESSEWRLLGTGRGEGLRTRPIPKGNGDGRAAGERPGGLLQVTRIATVTPTLGPAGCLVSRQLDFFSVETQSSGSVCSSSLQRPLCWCWLRRSCVAATESVAHLQTRLTPRAGRPPLWYYSAPPPNLTQATAVLPVLCLQVAPRPHLLAPTAAARSPRSSLEHFSAVPWRWSVTATSQAFPPAAISLRCLKANRPCAPVRKTTQLSLSRRAAGKTRLRPRRRPFVPRGRAGDGRGQSRARWVPTRLRDAAGSITSPPPAPSPALLLGPTQSSVLPLRPPFGLVRLYLYPVPPVWTTVITRTGYGPAAGRPSRAAVWPHRTPWAQTPPRRCPAGGSEPLDVNEGGQPGL